MDLLLWPVNFSLAYVGYTVLSPFNANGVEAGLKYSSAIALEARQKDIEGGLDLVLGISIEFLPFLLTAWPNGAPFAASHRALRPILLSYAANRFWISIRLSLNAVFH